MEEDAVAEKKPEKPRHVDMYVDSDKEDEKDRTVQSITPTSRATSSIARESIMRKSRQRSMRAVFKERSTKSFTDVNLQIKTGASLIPDLNLIINRMRNMKDDSFVYLDYMLPKDSEFFTPYSLREVEYCNLNIYKPYYTVTRHGVTYWRVSENFFTPLNQWQQEFQQFLSIIQIRTFSIFRLWKGFKVWEKTIKWRKLNYARNHLQNNLFIVIPQLAKAVLRMRADLVVLERLSFVNTENIEEWHPFYFLELHMRIYEQLNFLFHEFRGFVGKALCTYSLNISIWILIFPLSPQIVHALRPLWHVASIPMMRSITIHLSRKCERHTALWIEPGSAPFARP